MEPILRKEFLIRPTDVDRYGRLKPSTMLLFIQQIAGEHSDSFSLTYDGMAQQGIFWAVIRHRIQITRMPRENEVITLETWPMPTTRVAYPRATVAYDAQGNILFQSNCLWILMDLKERTMLLPKNSGVTVQGILQGNEIATPRSLQPQTHGCHVSRDVKYSDLDRNGHMNNSRYLDWAQDLPDSDFHRDHVMKELTVCYVNEALEKQTLELHYNLNEEGLMQLDIHRPGGEQSDDYDRIFAAKILYEKEIL